MNITVSVLGRFHGFNLAGELDRRGHLLKLITTQPRFSTRKFLIPDSKVSSLLPIEIANRLLDKLNTDRMLLHEIYDHLAACFIPKETEIFTGWSSSCLLSLRKAKKFGAFTVVDEGSSHIEFQRQILSDEYERQGLKCPSFSHRMAEREKFEYQEADFIFVPSKFVQETFTQFGVPKEKLRVIPYGVNLKEFTRIGKVDSMFRVIFTGAMTLRKGVHYLLQAFHELNLPNSELCLVGAMSAEMAVFLKRFENAKIIYHPAVPQSELYRYYSQGSIFCLPSLEEGMAMVLLQAMACELPILATTNTGAGDLIENGKEGFVIPIRSVEKLKEKIVYFYEHPETAQGMGKAAFKKVSENFTWDAYGRRIVESYKALR